MQYVFEIRRHVPGLKVHDKAGFDAAEPQNPFSGGELHESSGKLVGTSSKGRLTTTCYLALQL